MHLLENLEGQVQPGPFLTQRGSVGGHGEPREGPTNPAPSIVGREAVLAELDDLFPQDRTKMLDNLGGQFEGAAPFLEFMTAGGAGGPRGRTRLSGPLALRGPLRGGAVPAYPRAQGLGLPAFWFGLGAGFFAPPCTGPRLWAGPAFRHAGGAVGGGGARASSP